MRSARYYAKDVLLGLIAAASVGRSRQDCILMYHSVSGPGGVARGQFERQMKLISARYETATIGTFFAAVTSTERPVAVVTFDDGFLDNYEVALPILEGLGIRGTFFVIPGTLGKTHRNAFGEARVMNEQQVSEIAERGHEIGAHSMTHQKLTSLPPEEGEREIVSSKIRLEEIVGESVRSFAYPKGDVDREVRDLVENAGFTAAVTVEEGFPDPSTDPFALPRMSINSTMSMLQFWGKLASGYRWYLARRAAGRNPSLIR